MKIVKATTENRVDLGTVLPLDTPFGLNILPTNVCNFKCIYCGHSKKADSVKKEFLDIHLYNKCIEELKQFNRKIKVLLFTGLGEPLLHPEISEMIKIAKKAEVADTVRLITNAYLLTPEMSDKLIAAGLDSLKISMQGLTDEKYKEFCGVNVQVSHIFENIQYFYNNKKNTMVNIKVFDESFTSQQEKELFFKKCQNLCDIINVEYLQPYPESDQTLYHSNIEKNQSGEKRQKNHICPIPFYYYSLYQDGEIVPTCALFFEDYKNISMGNIREINIAKVWSSAKLNQFRRHHLEGKRFLYTACQKCDDYISTLCRREDNLDPYKEELLKKYF